MRLDERQHIDDAMEIARIGCDGVLDPPSPEDVILVGPFPPDAHDERIALAILIRHVYPRFRQDEPGTVSAWETGPLPKVESSVPHWCL